MFSLLSILLVVVSGIAVGAETYHLPLNQQTPNVDPGTEYWVSAANRLRQTYGFDALQKRQSTSSVPLTNQVRSFLTVRR
jgi:hypothetical protein